MSKGALEKYIYVSAVMKEKSVILNVYFIVINRIIYFTVIQ